MVTNSNILLFLALLPVILILIYIYKKDKVEKEPWGLIIKLLVFGAISCIPASFMESFVDHMGPQFPEGSLGYAVTMAFLSAALCEEICKFGFLWLGSWRHPEFGYRFDGIVYGVATALGFAALENVLYVFQFGFETAIIRAVMAVPLHAFCGLFMGIFYGAAKKASIDGKSSLKYFVLALIVPMMIHGIYDTLAFMADPTASIILFAFVIAMYIVSIIWVRRFSRDDWKSGFYPETQTLSAGAGGNRAAGMDPAGTKGYSYGSNYGRQTAMSHPHPGQVHEGKIILVCPYCRHGMRVPAGLGQIRVQCPHCKNEFVETT